MPRCLACGNRETFFEPQIEWQKVYYSPDGKIEDTKHFCYTSANEDVECARCRSLDIEW